MLGCFDQLSEVRRRALASLLPPPRLPLSAWIEANVRLPEGTTAVPGPMRLWPYQRAIADSIAGPSAERVTLVKPVRVGFTALITATIGNYVANEPAPVLCLLPTEADCRDYMVSDLEPTFEASPALCGALSREVEHGEDRSTILHRLFSGGSLKVVAAKAPRNLRRHTARVLLIAATGKSRSRAMSAFQPASLLATEKPVACGSSNTSSRSCDTSIPTKHCSIILASLPC